MKKIISVRVAALAWILLGLGLVPCFSQEQERPNGISAILQEIRNGIFTGLAETKLAREGDETAHWILENYSLQDLQDQDIQKSISLAVEMSFAHRQLIEPHTASVPKFSDILITYLLEQPHPESIRLLLTRNKDMLRKLEAGY